MTSIDELVKYLLMVQAAANLGAACVPYAALIAMNLTFDPGAFSLSDLSSLMLRDLRLNPDARRFKLQN